jgi:hypothetical protein
MLVLWPIIAQQNYLKLISCLIQDEAKRHLRRNALGALHLLKKKNAKKKFLASYKTRQSAI